MCFEEEHLDHVHAYIDFAYADHAILSKLVTCSTPRHDQSIAVSLSDEIVCLGWRYLVTEGQWCVPAGTTADCRVQA